MRPALGLQAYFHEDDRDRLGSAMMRSMETLGPWHLESRIIRPNGEIACITSDSRVLRLDARGKELHSFNVSLGMKLFGGRIHMLPSGRVLVPHNAEDKVVEYDGQGKAIWEVPAEKPVAAVFHCVKK